MEEIWKEYKTYKKTPFTKWLYVNVEISNLGNVRGYVGGKPVKVTICKSTGRRVFGWHTIYNLVWELFNGPIEKNWVVHHINLNPTDDRLENLIAMPRSEHIILHNRLRKYNPHTKETKQRISNKMSGKNNPMYGKSAMTGKFWYNNGEISKHFYSDEEAISQGYIYRGRFLGQNKIE